MNNWRHDESTWRYGVLKCGCIVYNDSSRVWCQACGEDWKMAALKASEIKDPEPKPSYLERAKAEDVLRYPREDRQMLSLISIAESLNRIAAILEDPAGGPSIIHELATISAALRNRPR